MWKYVPNCFLKSIKQWKNKTTKKPPMKIILFESKNTFLKLNWVKVHFVIFFVLFFIWGYFFWLFFGGGGLVCFLGFFWEVETLIWNISCRSFEITLGCFVKFQLLESYDHKNLQGPIFLKIVNKLKGFHAL